MAAAGLGYLVGRFITSVFMVFLIAFLLRPTPLLFQSALFELVWSIDLPTLSAKWFQRFAFRQALITCLCSCPTCPCQLSLCAGMHKSLCSFGHRYHSSYEMFLASRPRISFSMSTIALQRVRSFCASFMVCSKALSLLLSFLICPPRSRCLSHTNSSCFDP